MFMVVVMAAVIGRGTFRSLVREYAQHPEKKRGAPFWTSSFEEAPIMWHMTGAVCSAAATVTTLVYAAATGGEFFFGLVTLALAAGFISGIVTFKRKNA
jgi:hypothetical protein